MDQKQTFICRECQNEFDTEPDRCSWCGCPDFKKMTNYFITADIDNFVPKIEEIIDMETKRRSDMETKQSFACKECGDESKWKPAHCFWCGCSDFVELTTYSMTVDIENLVPESEVIKLKEEVEKLKKIIADLRSEIDNG